MSINIDDKYLDITNVPSDKLIAKEPLNQKETSELNWLSIFYGVSLIFILSILVNYLPLFTKLQKQVNSLEVNLSKTIESEKKFFRLAQTKLDQLVYKTEYRLSLIESKLENSVSRTAENFQKLDTKLIELVNKNENKLQIIDNEANILNDKTNEISAELKNTVEYFDKRIESVEAPIKELEYLLEEEFNENVTMAAENLHSKLDEEFYKTSIKIDKYFETFPETLKNEISELDGFYNRGKYDEKECTNILQKSVSKRLEKAVVPEIQSLHKFYMDELDNLKDRFYLSDLSSEQFEIQTDDELFSKDNLTQISKELNSKVYVMAFDESLTFIPWAGDAYDMVRSFVYDPRFEWQFREHIEKASVNIKTDVKHNFNIHRRKFNPVKIENLCRANFSTKRAVWSFLRDYDG